MQIDEVATLREFALNEARVLPRPFSALNEAAEMLRDGIGASSYDAYALAGPDMTLFADDLGLRTLAANERGAAGFPSASLLGEAHARGFLSREEMLRDLGRLIQFNHAFVPVSADLLYGVLVDNAFELNSTVLRALDRLSLAHANATSASSVAADLLRLVSLSPIGGAKLEALATVLFEVLSRGQNATRALRLLNGALQTRFALLSLDYERLRDWMNAFLLSRTGNGIEQS